MRKTIVVLAALMTAQAAHAEKVGIVVTGEATLQPQLASQLEKWLHDRGRTYVPGALEPDEISTLIDCFVLEDLGCAKGLIEARATSRALVYARIEQIANADGTRDISVTGYWFQKNADAIAERRVCTQCTDPKLFATVDEMMLALVATPPVGVSTPRAAEAPSVASAEPVVADDEQTGMARRYLPLGLLGAGGVALLSGFVLIGIDEDPEPTGVQGPTYRDTATAGVVFGAAGAAALGVGIYLYMTDKRRSQPVASISRDGGFIGWAGRF